MKRGILWRGAAAVSVLLLVSTVAACEEAPRYTSFAVVRAPHPPWRPAGNATTTPEDAFRSQSPDALRVPFPALPAAAETTFANGVRVITMRRSGLPVVAIRAVVARGASAAPEGVAPFVAALLFEGTRRHEADAIHDSFADMGAAYHAGATRDAVTADVKVPSWNASPALDLLTQIVREASFPARKVEPARMHRLGTIDERTAAPALLATDQLDVMLYPSGHPYRIPADGDADATRRVQREDLETFWKTAAVPSQTTFVVAGDLDRTAIESKLHALVDDWSGPPAAAPRVPEATTSGGPRVMFVDHAGDSQSVLRLGWLAPDRDSPDLPALRAVSAALARSVTGRLDKVLRGQHGETYDVASWVTGRAGSNEFVIQTSVERDRTAEALREILAEVARVRRQALDESELPALNAGLEERLWQSFETCSDAVEAFTPAAVYREPLDRFFARLRAATEVRPEDALRAASRYLTTESRALAIVGDAARVRPSLDGLGLGDIVMRPAPVPATLAAAGGTASR
jgi:predicted Zn-dependent peptidase